MFGSDFNLLGTGETVEGRMAIWQKDNNPVQVERSIGCSSQDGKYVLKKYLSERPERFSFASCIHKLTHQTAARRFAVFLQPFGIFRVFTR